MATIQLNLELTDEQYKGLMDSSLEKVIGDEETINALRDTITTQMASYLTDHTDIIKKMYYDHNAFGWEMGVNGLTKAIIKEAASDAAAQFKAAVTSYMMDMAKDQPIEPLLSKILMQAVLAGAVSGLDSWKEMISTDILNQHTTLHSVMERMGISDN